MAKTESTAINNLIELTTTATPRKPAPDEDLMFTDPSRRPPVARAVSVPRMSATLTNAAPVEPLPRGRGAAGTQQNALTPAVRVTTAPPTRSMTIPPMPSLPPPSPPRPSRPSLPPPVRQASAAVVAGPRVPPPPPTDPSFDSAPIAPIDLTDQSWFEDSRAVDPVIGPVSESTWVGTVQVPKQTTTAQWLGKLALPMGAMIVVGIVVGGYIAHEGDGGNKREPVLASEPVAAAEPAKPEPAIAAPVAVAVAAMPAVAAPVTSEPVAFVDVRLDSKPSGATVMLVDRGKTMFLGTTPISTALDPSRQYDVVFTYKDRPTLLEHIDPRTQSKLAVTLSRSGSKSATAPVTEIAPPKVAKVAKVEAPKAIVKEAPKAEAPKAGGAGVLMVSSKPPCEIYIDGKATGLMTPQRSLPLAAGTHKVTLINSADKIKKTLTIQITADQPTKLIQDLMAK